MHSIILLSIYPPVPTLQVGFDFMVDDKHKVWLLECNASPSLAPSTQVKKRLVVSFTNIFT